MIYDICNSSMCRVVNTDKYSECLAHVSRITRWQTHVLFLLIIVCYTQYVNQIFCWLPSLKDMLLHYWMWRCKCKYSWNFWFKNVIWYGKLVYRVTDKFGKALRCAVPDTSSKDNSSNATTHGKSTNRK